MTIHTITIPQFHNTITILQIFYIQLQLELQLQLQLQFYNFTYNYNFTILHTIKITIISQQYN